MANRINTFLLKRSSIPGKIPSPGQLLLGEIALNSADAILYTSGTTANSILPIGWDRISRTGDTMSGTLYAPTISATTYLNLPISIVNFSNLFSTGLIDTGTNVDSITYSNFFGEGAGFSALYASNSNFLGYQAGRDATNAEYSNFIGNQAGFGATNSNDSNFLGTQAGFGASNAHNSNFIGNQAGNGAINASDSNFMGHYAGNGATNAFNSNFIGEGAGHDAIDAHQSNFMGNEAGAGANNADFANFMGQLAGGFAVNATNSNFIGQQAGYQASDAQFSNFIGAYAGKNATSANQSNFIGNQAGNGATNAYQSNFFGYYAGNSATEASNSNLFGYQAGKTFTNNNIGSNNIIIGTNISLPSGATNSINIGGVLFGKNTYSDTIGDPNILPKNNGGIGVNVVNPSEALHVSGNTLINGNLTANTISATTYYNLPLDIRVTGGTYSNGTAVFRNNTGGTFSVTGLTTPFTGGTVNGATIFTNGLTTTTISATTYQNLPLDIKVTGSSFNNSTYDLTLTRNDGVILTSNLGILSSDMNVTGGTYNINTGIVTFTNNSGGTFTVSGFTSGMTDTYTTGGTYSNGTTTFTKTNGGTYSVSGYTTPFTGGTVTGTTIFTNGLSANTFSATTYQNLPIDVRVTGGTYSSGTAVFSNNTGGTFSVTGLTTPFTGGTVTGATIFTNGLSANTISATSINKVDYIIFNTGTTSATTVPGTVYFDNTEKALSYNTSINQGVTVNLGQQQYLRVFNNSGSDIKKGKTLEVLSTYNNLPNVTLAVNKLSGFDVIGVSAENIPNNSEGIVITSGILSDITLTGVSVGSLVYASESVPGDFYDGNKIFKFPLTARTTSIGYVLQTGTTTGKLLVKIKNENSVLSMTDLQRNILEGNTLSTGTFAFSGITLSTGNTFNVGKMEGWVIDNISDYLRPTTTYVSYSGQSGLTTPYLSSHTETYISLTTAATLNLTYQYPSPEERRKNIYLGKLGHANKTNIINVFNEPDLDISPLSQLRDMFAPIKLINSGVVASPNGVNLNFNTSSGTIYGLGINFINNPLNPSSLYVPATSPTTFQYRTQTGGTATNTTTIIPGYYDLNGVVTAIGTPAKQATNQRIYLVQNGQFRIQYGQTVYPDLASAVSAAQVETFTTFSNFRDNAILIGILSLRSDTTNLSDPLYAQFLFVSKFGELGGGTGGLSTTTLQQAYNNSENPEIVINSTLDGLSIKNGTGNEDNVTNLLEGINTAGITTSFIRSDGYISGSTFKSNGAFINNNGITANTISATTYQNLPIDVRVTGGTYSNGTAVFINNTGGTFSVTGFSTSTGNGTTFTGGTVTGATIFTNGLSANTISATTYQNLPLDIRVTGGTYSNGTAVFNNNTGGTFSVTGFSIGNEYWSGGTGLNSVVQIGSNSLAGGKGALAGGSGNSANSQYSVAMGINSIADGFELLPVKTQKNVISGITMTSSDPYDETFGVVFSGDVFSEWYDYFYGVYYSENSFIIDDGVGNTYTLNNQNIIDLYYYVDSTYIVCPTIPLTSYTTISGTPFYDVTTPFERPAFVMGSNSVVTGSNSIVLGSNITGTSNNTTYIDSLNIKTTNTGETNFNTLAITSGGTVIKYLQPLTIINTSSLISTGLLGSGYQATNANYSNFFGEYAGYQATNASKSNFLGNGAGYNATSASQSNFFGEGAGRDATSANFSNFFGWNAGYSATSASQSNFFGPGAGYNATNASYSNFMGNGAGYKATGASYSNFIGLTAGYLATGATQSNFFGEGAGFRATGASYSNFFGKNAGRDASNAYQSNFFGQFAGYQATNAYYSNFLGINAGYQATNASYSNFLGINAGLQATNASYSNFLGYYAGLQATYAYYSNFLGQYAGRDATSANFSNFIGSYAGWGATGASYSNLFGYNVGNAGGGAGLGSNNIIIGTNISLPSNTTNSINLGGVLFGSNTYATTTGNPSLTAQTTGRIGINVVNPSEALHVSGNVLINGDLTTNTISATTYYNLPLDIRVTGGTYSSGTAIFINNTGGTFSVTGFSTSTGGGTTFTGGTVTGATIFTNGLSANTISATTYQNLPLDITVTGGTYSNGTAVFSNNTGGTFSVTGFSTSTGGGTTFTGGTVTGATIFTNGLSANTISATTIEGGDLDFMMISLFRTLYNY